MAEGSSSDFLNEDEAGLVINASKRGNYFICIIFCSFAILALMC